MHRDTRESEKKVADNCDGPAARKRGEHGDHDVELLFNGDTPERVNRTSNPAVMKDVPVAAKKVKASQASGSAVPTPGTK